MIVVDAAPLIYLGKVGRLKLLRELYGKILIPQGVWDEVVGRGDRPGASEVEACVKEGWIKTERASVPRSLQAEGAEGPDGEVIILARKHRTRLLTNDRSLARIAWTHGVSPLWLTQAIIEAVDRRILSTSEARVLLRDLVRGGLRVGSEVLAEVIHLIELRE